MTEVVPVGRSWRSLRVFAKYEIGVVVILFGKSFSKCSFFLMIN